jgi:hypothetical protein
MRQEYPFHPPASNLKNLGKNLTYRIEAKRKTGSFRSVISNQAKERGAPLLASPAEPGFR